MRFFLFIIILVAIYGNSYSQRVDLQTFREQMNVISCDTSLSIHFYKYDFLNEKSLFIGYGDEVKGISSFEFINTLGYKIYVQPLDQIFFDEIPFWMEIDKYSYEPKKTIIHFHTVGIQKYRNKKFIEGIIVLEKNSKNQWVKTFDKISEFSIKY